MPVLPSHTKHASLHKARRTNPPTPLIRGTRHNASLPLLTKMIEEHAINCVTTSQSSWETVESCACLISLTKAEVWRERHAIKGVTTSQRYFPKGACCPGLAPLTRGVGGFCVPSAPVYKANPKSVPSVLSAIQNKLRYDEPTSFSKYTRS